MKIRPRNDCVLVKRGKPETTTKGGIIIPESAQTRAYEGEVLAVGPGKVLDDGTTLKPEVKPGDHVYWGKSATGDAIKQEYGPQEDEALFLIRAGEILAVIERTP